MAEAVLFRIFWTFVAIFIDKNDIFFCLIFIVILICIANGAKLSFASALLVVPDFAETHPNTKFVPIFIGRNNNKHPVMLLFQLHFVSCCYRVADYPSPEFIALDPNFHFQICKTCGL